MPISSHYEVLTFNGHYPFSEGVASYIMKDDKWPAIKFGKNAIEVGKEGLKVLYGEDAKESLNSRYIPFNHSIVDQVKLGDKIEKFIFNFSDFYSIELNDRQRYNFSNCYAELVSVAQTDVQQLALDKLRVSLNTRDLRDSQITDYRYPAGNAVQE